VFRKAEEIGFLKKIEVEEIGYIKNISDGFSFILSSTHSLQNVQMVNN
jgi:hypothetical protein